MAFKLKLWYREKIQAPVAVYLGVRAVPVCTPSALRHHLPGWPRNSSASPCTGETNGSAGLFDTNTDLKEGDWLNSTTKHLMNPYRNSPGGNFGQPLSPRHLLLCLVQLLDTIFVLKMCWLTPWVEKLAVPGTSPGSFSHRIDQTI